MFANNTYESVKKSVLDKVLRDGRFTIPEIAGETGLSSTTIAKHISQMLSNRLLEEIGAEDTRRKGRKAIVYGIRPDSHYFLGVDVKNAGLGTGLMDFSGKLLLSDKNPDYRFENSHTNFDLVCTSISSFLERLDDDTRSRIRAIGISLGGRVNSANGTSATIFNFEETQDASLSSILSERFSLPVYIENDTKALCYADYLATGKKWPNVLYANVSWGLGLGIIINGELYYGSRGYSGEMGHIHTYDNNIMCHCGKKGCMETEVSGMAIHRKLIERVTAGEASALSYKIRKNEQITEDDIVQATEQEDPLCIELVSETGRELGKQLAGMINLFNPDCIIIGGKFSRVSSYYFQQQAAVAVKQYSLKLMSRDVPIITSPLGEDAGILGAAICARKSIFSY